MGAARWLGYRRGARSSGLVRHSGEPVDVSAVHGLPLKEQGHERVEFFPVCPQQPYRAFLGLP
jgi:hypothetical protein